MYRQSTHVMITQLQVNFTAGGKWSHNFAFSPGQFILHSNTGYIQHASTFVPIPAIPNP